MAKKKKSKKQIRLEKKNAAEGKKILYIALGVTALFLLLSYLFFLRNM